MNSRPFLKWPGGKYRLIQRIRDKLEPGQRLVEPFTGSGAVFLNTDYPSYLLADSNPDLINLYQQLTSEGLDFIRYCSTFFKPSNNDNARYYRFREEFNNTRNRRRKSALFLYLNRHCYNGLVRYNKSGGFNTPFGLHRSPYFPEKEMQRFLQAAEQAEFVNMGFQICMDSAREGDIVYCDPPYAPLSSTACFTDYHTGGFNWDEQMQLAELSAKLATRGIPVVISNHDTPAIRKLYREAGARIARFQVQRMISANAARRTRAGELLAVFSQ